MKKKAYSSVAVKDVQLAQLLARRAGAAVDVGCDIGKEHILVVLRWGPGDFEKPWRVRNPSELTRLRDLLVAAAQGRQVRIGMEPTGTYGDPLRQLLADAGLAVYRVGTKAAHDYAEVFDGVPSQHDGKDAAVVAELVGLEKGRVWPFTAGEAWEQEVRYWVARLVVETRQLQGWVGRLEGLLMRHWPELTRSVRRLTSVTLLQAVASYGDPRRLAADPGAAGQLEKWSRGRWGPEKLAQVVEAAGASVGVRVGVWSRRLLRGYARRALQAKRRVQRARRELRRLGQGHPVLEAQGQVVGLPTACVLWVYLGDPQGYESAGAYRKAMGLNLKERSSGRYQGELKLSKRGQAEVRRLLFFAALRWSQREPVRSWYLARKQAAAKGERRGGRSALVALMRKLALSLQPLGVRGGVFDVGRLFRKESAAASKRAAPASAPEGRAAPKGRGRVGP
jgi:transposase